MISRLVFCRWGGVCCSFETQEHARHQALLKPATLLGCARTCRSMSLAWPSHSTRTLRKSKCRATTTAVAAIDQEPVQPANTAKPTADQIFDLHHVPHISPSLLLYFPIGMLITSVTLAHQSTSHTLFLPAGVLLASIRMVLWVMLLAADVPWLTDNNTSIASELYFQSHTHCCSRYNAFGWMLARLCSI